jgi:hypothetical protein
MKPNLKWIAISVLIALLWAGFKLVNEFSEKQPSGSDQSANSQSLIRNSSSTHESNFTNNPVTSRHNSSPINPINAAKRLEVICQDRNINILTRGELSGEILSELCKAGYREDAWNLIDPMSGRLRRSQLVGFFSSAELTSEQALVKINLLSGTDDKDAAVTGYLLSLNPQQMREFAEDNLFKEIAGKANESFLGKFTNLLGSRIANYHYQEEGTDEQFRTEIASLSADFHQRGLISDHGYAMILDENPASDSFEKYQIFSAAKETSPSPDAQRLREKMIKSMVESDASKALNQISATSQGNGQKDMLVALETYGTMDPAGANQWFLENTENLDTQQKDAAAVAFFKLAIKDKKAEDAGSWMNRIQDSNAKKWAVDYQAKHTPPPQ